MIFVKKIGICFGDVFFQTEVYTFLGNVYNLAFLQEDKEKIFATDQPPLRNL